MSKHDDTILITCGLIDTLANQAIIVCGDLNCHGDDSNSIDDRLAAVFNAMNMKQYVHGPTHENRLLDVLACSDDRLIRDVIVDDAVNVSDHCLITARLKSNRKRWSPVANNFRQLSRMDFKALPCCRLHVVHSEWTSHQPREIGGGAHMHSTAIKSGRMT